MRVYRQLNLRPVCFVQLLQDLDFNKEKVEVVSLGDGAEKVPPIDGLLPLRVPIIGGSTKGWMLPNARRGAEQVAVDADTSGDVSGDISKMSVLDFNDRFVPPPEKALTKGGAPVVKRWRRMLSFDPARCPPHLAARGGCAKEVSLGRWLANQGAAWGEAVVGRPVFVRPRTWTYSPGDYVNAERLAAERHERDGRDWCGPLRAKINAKLKKLHALRARAGFIRELRKRLGNANEVVTEEMVRVLKATAIVQQVKHTVDGKVNSVEKEKQVTDGGEAFFGIRFNVSLLVLDVWPLL